MLVVNTNYKVGAYIRLSRDDGDKQESESIGNQRKIIERYVKESGLSLTSEYVDDGWSGTTFNRPSFLRMIEDIKSKKIDMIVTKDLSRLGRDYIQTGYYIENFFPENNIRYISILDGIDTFSNSSNNDITPFKAILNDMYAKDISKKVRSVIREKQINGEFMCSTPPYGYKKNPDKKNSLIVDYMSASIVKKIFEMYDNGIGSVRIAQYLNDNHYLPPRKYRQEEKIQDVNCDKKWQEVTIMNMLGNEVYIGNLVQNKTPIISYKVKKIRKTAIDEQIKVENTHEAIIDKELFYRIKPVLEVRRRNSEFKYEYLFRKLLYCKHCGRKLQIVLKKKNASSRPKIPYITDSDSKGRGCYSLNMNYYKFEEYMINLIKKICDLYHNNEVFYKLYNQLTNNTCVLKDKYDNDIKNIEYSIRSINTKLDKIYKDRLNDIITDRDYKRYSEDFINERISLINEKNEIEVKLKTFGQKILSTKEKDEELEKYIKDFLRSDKINEKELYRLVNKIEIDKDKNIYIYFNFSKLDIISQNIQEFIEVDEILKSKKFKKQKVKIHSNINDYSINSVL